MRQSGPTHNRWNRMRSRAPPSGTVSDLLDFLKEPLPSAGAVHGRNRGADPRRHTATTTDASAGCHVGILMNRRGGDRWPRTGAGARSTPPRVRHIDAEGEGWRSYVISL